MRTRLDEIVEEELARSGFANANQMKRYMDATAERAFRHGVERTMKNLTPCPRWNHFHYEVGHPEVQPAPAGEKGQPIYFTPCPPWCPTPNEHFGQCTYRRKGERRNLLLPRRSFVWRRPEDGKSYGSIYEDIEAGCWKWDRRSGKDRRCR